MSILKISLSTLIRWTELDRPKEKKKNREASRDKPALSKKYAQRRRK